MNLRIGIARGITKIEDLKPGAVFIHRGKLAVKMNQDHFPFEPCNCVVIGTGDNLYDFTVDAEEFNTTYVTLVLIYQN